MRRILIPILALLSLPALGASYYVKTTGSNSNNGTDPSTPFLTIAKCTSLMVAGDTCTVYAGHYAERVTVPSGALGNPTTLQANLNDAVYIDNGVDETNKSYWVVGGAAGHGFIIAQGYTANRAFFVSGSVGGVISYNTIGGTSTLAGGTVGCISGSGTQMYIKFNTLQWCGLFGDGSATWPDTTHHRGDVGISGTYAGALIEGNTLLHTADFLASIGNGPNTNGASGIMVRGNFAGTALESTDCLADFGGNTSANQVCHLDFWQSASSNYVTLERNTVQTVNPSAGNVGRGIHFSLLQCAPASNNNQPCRDVIERYNLFVNNVQGAAFVGTDATQGEPTLYVRQYNNTIASNGNGNDNSQTFLANTYASGLHGVSKNNINYNSIRQLSHPAGILIDANSALDFVSWKDMFTSSLSTFDLTGLCNFHPANCNIVGHAPILNQDPKFVDPLSDWHLQAGSPALGAADYLAVVTSANGSGTSVVVDDCHHFQWGYGLTGVLGDTVGFGASSAAAKANSVRLTSIDYSTCTLTWNGSISWNNGDHAYLIADSYGNNTPGFENGGTAPNIGAFGLTPIAPYTGTLTCGGNGNGSIASSDSSITMSCVAGVATCTVGTAVGNNGCSTNYTVNATPTFTETPSGSTFSGWGGDGTCTGTSSACTTAPINAPFAITLTFGLGPTINNSCGTRCVMNARAIPQFTITTANVQGAPDQQWIVLATNPVDLYQAIGCTTDPCIAAYSGPSVVIPMPVFSTAYSAVAQANGLFSSVSIASVTINPLTYGTYNH